MNVEMINLCQLVAIINVYGMHQKVPANKKGNYALNIRPEKVNICA